MNQALAFFVLCGVLAAIVGAFTLNTALLSVGLTVAVPIYLVLVARHIDPKEEDQ